MPSPHSASTLIPKEIDQFSALAQSWWDPEGPMAPLHEMNPCRIQYILDHLRQRFEVKPASLQPLQVLDVGCGAGLVTEPFARLKAHVTGIDGSQDMIEVAKEHAHSMDLDVRYYQSTIEAWAETHPQKYDCITALEIVEHVQDVNLFLRSCLRALKPQGLLFISTLNRTWKSYMVAILGAEYILNKIPKGTHSWSQFLRPSEIEACTQPFGYRFVDLKGMLYHPLNKKWHLVEQRLGVNYIGVIAAGQV